MKEYQSTSISFDHQLTKALHPGDAPEDLRLNLLKAAKTQGTHRTWHALGIAAVLMLLLGSGAWGWMAHWNQREGERFTRAALQDFIQVQRMDFTVDASAQESMEKCMERCRQWSAQAVGFSATLPKSLADQPLKGGNACTMPSCRSACFLLQDGRAVYVFEHTLKGLDVGSNKRPMIIASGYRARAWNEDGRGYVLIEPPGRWKS
jgi:hypothetical protein